MARTRSIAHARVVAHPRYWQRPTGAVLLRLRLRQRRLRLADRWIGGSFRGDEHAVLAPERDISMKIRSGQLAPQYTMRDMRWPLSLACSANVPGSGGACSVYYACRCAIGVSPVQADDGAAGKGCAHSFLASGAGEAVQTSVAMFAAGAPRNRGRRGRLRWEDVAGNMARPVKTPQVTRDEVGRVWRDLAGSGGSARP